VSAHIAALNAQRAVMDAIKPTKESPKTIALVRLSKKKQRRLRTQTTISTNHKKQEEQTKNENAEAARMHTEEVNAIMAQFASMAKK